MKNAIRNAKTEKSPALAMMAILLNILIEMYQALGHFCAHTGQIGPGEPSGNGEMTLPSRHRSSNPGGLRPSTLPLGHRGSPQF